MLKLCKNGFKTLLLTAIITTIAVGALWCGGDVGTNTNNYTLLININPIGGGSVTRSPDKSTYRTGEQVRITATPTSGYKFVSWSGVSTSTNTIVTVTMDKDLTLTANFQQLSYESVVIGGKRWMSKNMNTYTANSWCHENKDSCAKYGRYYTWDAAKTVCPSGWRLPSSIDWDNLCQAVGGERTREVTELPNGDIFVFFAWYGAGNKLKARSGWYDFKGGTANGTDNYGFSALPSGSVVDNSIYNIGTRGVWWTATEATSARARARDMVGGFDRVGEYNDYDKIGGFSVRCIQD